MAVISIPYEPDLDQIASSLAQAAKNNEILAILLKIDNDGGDIGCFSFIHDLIRKIRTIKPVVSIITGNACSCGYMLASATGYIIAPSGSDIGCIGTILEIEKFSNPKQTGDVEATLEWNYFVVENLRRSITHIKNL